MEHVIRFEWRRRTRLALRALSDGAVGARSAFLSISSCKKAFWHTVATFYDQQAQSENSDAEYLLWNKKKLSNLTKSVTMRLLQKLFIEQAVDRVRQVKQSRDLLIDVVGEERADEEISTRVKAVALPASVDEFRDSIRTWFLQEGVPVRFFLKPWRGSLDDAQGQADLWDEMEKAFDYSYISQDS